MRFGFVTCVQLGYSCMEAIYDAGGTLELAITLEDHKSREKSGRVYLDDFCSRHEVDLVKICNVNDERAVEAIRQRSIDWLFIIGWSQIAGREVLNAPLLGALGMHPTLLPQGRGRAAIPWAILKNLPKTGVTMFKLDQGVDTGPILAQREIPLSPNTDAAELYEAVDAAHVGLMREVFPRLREGSVTLVEQDESAATLWPGRRPEDGRIDCDASVVEAERLVRALTHPYPGAFLDREGQRLIIWKSEIVADEDQTDGAFLIPFRDGSLRCLEWEISPAGG